MKPRDITPDLRYSRHIALPDFGPHGQRQLNRSRVLIIGVGGLGSPAAMYLAAAGVGEIILCDFDEVDLSNLQRQIAHTTDDLGELKVESAADTLLAINPEIAVYVIDERMTEQELLEEVEAVDVVLDCTDNFGSRFAINEACVKTGVPLVSGAAIRYEGHLTVFQPQLESSPCYACLYDETGDEFENCRSNGVLAPVVGVIGSLMAVETIKLITGIGTPLTGTLSQYDALTGQWRSSGVVKDPECRACAHAQALRDARQENAEGIKNA
ncbi:MAG: HesA/MoeB/ThiF family protein [Gammaproteobacteria bacterium]|nr:HesA/MoeB/ThiF family protein [Gammaproteobacteria bacterium]